MTTNFTSKRPGSCVAIALAVILDVPCDPLITKYKCDKIIAKDQKPPYCYRGMNPAEVTHECYLHGFMCMEFPITVTTYTTGITHDAPYLLDEEFLKSKNGLLYGYDHCVAWKDDRIIDNGKQLPVKFDGNIKGYYMFTWIKRFSFNHQS